MEIKATGLPKTIEDYQVALNAAFAGGKAYGLAQRTWVGLTHEKRVSIICEDENRSLLERCERIEQVLKEDNGA